MDPTQTPPEAAGLLEQMHNIDAPNAVTWWPLAMGWWVLIIVSLISIYGLTQFAWHQYRHNAYRRHALSLLGQLTPTADAEFATAISNLLKRVALAAYPQQRAVIARAYGASWINWLNKTCKQPPFADKETIHNSAEALSHGPYQTNVQFDAVELQRCARAWIKNHV